MKFLITGGAGYIGSHMAKMLFRAGHDAIVFDNLSTGHSEAVKWGPLFKGDLRNMDDLSTIFGKYQFDGVMHFASKSIVSESMLHPELYRHNNVTGSNNLLEQMRIHGVSRIIFSSSASVFGDPIQQFINESHPTNPINVYGQTKLKVEELLQQYGLSHGIESVSLRYFNAAGADPDCEIGELHDPETHLIPNILRIALEGGREHLQVYGGDYDTKDGTCVRDYIHVNDICSAHLLAFDFLVKHGGAHAFNLGNGNGFSVQEVINAAIQICNRDIPYKICDRRSGDPSRLIADSEKARRIMLWMPKFKLLDHIVSSAWAWQQHIYNNDIT